jgi:hypothetical protein
MRTSIRVPEHDAAIVTARAREEAGNVENLPERGMPNKSHAVPWQGRLLGSNWTGVPCPDPYATTSAWAGVSCRGGRVAALVLENMGLKGPLPDSLANLTMLQNVSFASNGLSGDTCMYACIDICMQAVSDKTCTHARQI